MLLSVILEQKIGTEKFCLHRNVGNSGKKNLVKAKAKFSRATFKFFSSMFWSQNADIALLLCFTECNILLSLWQVPFLLCSSPCWICHSSDISNISGSPWILGFTFTALHSDLSRPRFIDTLATWMVSMTFFNQGGGFHNCFISNSRTTRLMLPRFATYFVWNVHPSFNCIFISFDMLNKFSFDLGVFLSISFSWVDRVNRKVLPLRAEFFFFNFIPGLSLHCYLSE